MNNSHAPLMKAENLFNTINSFRVGKTRQSYRRDTPPYYENQYIKLIRIDSGNRAGGQSVIRGKQWSIIFEPKLAFTLLPGWKILHNRYGDDIKITPVTRGVLKGCHAIRFYHMSEDPTDEIILGILDFIFFYNNHNNE